MTKKQEMFKDNLQISLGGLYADIWSSLVAITNMSFTMVPSIDGGFGVKNDDGSFTGMVKDSLGGINALPIGKQSRHKKG